MHTFIIGNDYKYVVRNARSATAPGTPIPTSATGTLTVRHPPADDGTLGATVGGQAWPATFAWSAADNGFVAVVQGSITVVNRGIYETTATLDGGPGLQWTEVEEMRAYRKSR